MPFKTFLTLTFCSGAELMVNGCHSKKAISGILTKTQSPGEKLNLAGFWMTRPVTLDGKTSPAVTKVFPKSPALTEISLNTITRFELNMRLYKTTLMAGSDGLRKIQ